MRSQHSWRPPSRHRPEPGRRATDANLPPQASFDPPLVVAAVKADSGSAAIIARGLGDRHRGAGDRTVCVAEVRGVGVRNAAATPLLLRRTGMNQCG
jgi:flavin reductase (DIM6/NTAB) family NADH-FMN oxidoreductase RutF